MSLPAHVLDFDEIKGWDKYAADVVRSKRKKEYDELVHDLKKGQVIVIKCTVGELAQPVHMMIRDFQCFNWAMDRIEDPKSNVAYIAFGIGEMYLE